MLQLGQDGNINVLLWFLLGKSLREKRRKRMSERTFLQLLNAQP